MWDVIIRQEYFEESNYEVGDGGMHGSRVRWHTMNNRMKVSSRNWESKSSVQQGSVLGIRPIFGELRGEHHVFPLALYWYGPKANVWSREKLCPMLKVKRLFLQIQRSFVVLQQHPLQLPSTKTASVVGIEMLGMELRY